MTPEEFILIHADRRYDATKAREYYLRTRELKGRKPAQSAPAVVRMPGKKKPISVARSAPAKVSPPKSSKQLREESRKRIDSLNKKLVRLKGVLTKLLADSKSGKKTTEAKGGKAKASGGSDRKLTSAQKNEQAKRSKDFYDKNKKKLAPKKDDKPTAKDVEKQIAETRAKIKQVQTQLKAAIAKQRARR